MVDVSEITNVSIGDEVVLIGNSQDKIISVDDIANTIGTIGYEILCNISKRLKEEQEILL